MGKLLSSFTYPRNAFGASADDSADKVLDLLHRVETDTLRRSPSDPTKYKDEPFNDMRALLAVVTGPPSEPDITHIGYRFRNFAERSPTAAWRWLLTRSLWLYSVPNGTNVSVNKAAGEIGVRFNFFDMITRLAVHLSALPSPQNILFFDELLPVLEFDRNWALSSEELHDAVMAERQRRGLRNISDHDQLLEVLEARYDIGRDNMNKVFAGAFGQTGLFTMIGNPMVGLHLDPGAYERPVLGKRLRFVLDHPRIYSAETMQ